MFFFNDKLFFNGKKIPKILYIRVRFGKSAASSRNSETKIKAYPINTHNQLEELKYLFPNSEINLEHSFNPHKEFTHIDVNGISLEVNTPMESAKSAINVILTEWFPEIKLIK